MTRRDRPDAATVARDLAEDVASDLRAAVRLRARASLVVSGGRSPTALFEHLSQAQVDWSRVTVTLADERWVPADSAASNERLVRSTLLRNAAAGAHFISLREHANSAGLAASRMTGWLRRHPTPFDVVLLGMGNDGHFASLFPRTPNLSEALNPTAPRRCLVTRAPASPRVRLSLNLAALTHARRVILQISGSTKRRVLARAAGANFSLPVAVLLQHARHPLDVYWSP